MQSTRVLYSSRAQGFDAAQLCLVLSFAMIVPHPWAMSFMSIHDLTPLMLQPPASHLLKHFIRSGQRTPTYFGELLVPKTALSSLFRSFLHSLSLLLGLAKAGRVHGLRCPPLDGLQSGVVVGAAVSNFLLPMWLEAECNHRPFLF